MESVLKAVQLLWVNLIMDTFAALALATDPPTEKILDRPPQGKKAPLITINMWKMIVGQTIYQMVVSLVLYFAGPEILNYDRGDEIKELELNTIIFNCFVWMQIFNQFNNRRLDNKFNIFEGIHRNYFFMAINAIMVGLQVCIIYVGSRAFSIKPGGLNSEQWAISVITALMCWPFAVLVRVFPDPWFAAVAQVVGKPFVIVYRALGRAWNATFGRLFKSLKSQRKDNNDDEDDNDAPQNINEMVDPEKESDPETAQNPNIPAIIAPDEPATLQVPQPPRVEVTDSDPPKPTS